MQMPKEELDKINLASNKQTFDRSKADELTFDTNLYLGLALGGLTIGSLAALWAAVIWEKPSDLATLNEKQRSKKMRAWTPSVWFGRAGGGLQLRKNF